MQQILSRKLLGAAAGLALTACQHMPAGLPYNVTEDCRVERRAAVQGPVVVARDTQPAKFLPAALHGVGTDRLHVALAKTDTMIDARAEPNVMIAQVRAPTPAKVPPPAAPGGPPRERGGGGFGGFGFGIGLPLPGFGPAPQPDAADGLVESGPQFPAAFSMNCAPVHGFLRGGWPVVIDYQTTGGSTAVLEIHTTASQEPYAVPLERADRRRLVTFALPQTYGDTPQVALYLVRAERQSAGGGVQLFGLGAGPGAVGSVAIDQVDFRPGNMRVSQKQRASYSFYSRSDFNRAVVEILRVQRSGGDITVTLARSTSLDVGVNRGTWVGKKEQMTWDGTDGGNRVSTGPHLLQVRAWLTQDARDWVAAWSPGTVVVAE
ncbi:MAG: hypothetical protein ACXWUU_18080 [Burkholderiales bacterium]